MAPVNLFRMVQRIVILVVLFLGMRHSFALSSDRGSCINNLRIIEGGKDQAALERKLKDGDLVEAKVLAEFLKDRHLPECPGGGRYVIRTIGAEPWCTVHGGASEFELNLWDQVYETREKAIRVLVIGGVLGTIGFFILRFLIRAQRGE